MLDKRNTYNLRKMREFIVESSCKKIEKISKKLLTKVNEYDNMYLYRRKILQA